MYRKVMLLVFAAVFLALYSGGALAAEGDVLWGPNNVSGSDNPVYAVAANNGMVAVAGTKTGSFTMVLYNATNGDATTVTDLPDGTLRGLATDGANIFLGGTLANGTGNNTGIITLYDSEGNKDSHFPKTVDYGDGSYAEGGIVDVAAAAGLGIVTGTAYNGTYLYIKTAVFKDDGTQKMIKEKGSTSYNCTAVGVAANTSYLVVVGNTQNATTSGIITVVYDYTNEKWSKLYNTGNQSRAVDVAIDGSGNVYVLAEAVNASRGDNDTLLLKYDSDGNLKWAKWFDMNDMKVNDHPVTLALDSDGNIYVAGYYEYNSDDFFVVKFGSDGTVKWFLQDGSEDYRDRVSSMVIDSSDNVIVTGYSYDGVDYNYRTIFVESKDTSGGNIKWAALTTSSNDEYAKSVAVTPDDSVVVVTGLMASGENTYISTLAYQGGGERFTNELPSGDDRVVVIKKPKTDPDPANGIYVGVGEVATTKGKTMKLSLSFPQYTDSSGNPLAVNIYVAIQIPYTDKCGNYHNDLYFLNSDGHFELMTESNTIKPWKKNVQDNVDEEVIPPFNLKDPLLNQNIYLDTTYWFYTLVVPATVKDDLTDLDPNGKWECTYFSLELYE